METPTRPISLQDSSAFEVSPVLEESTSTPLSTHWIPLHELITHWTAVDSLLVPAPVAPLLTAVGHALFALSRETRALRLYTLAWQKQQRHAPRAEISISGRSHQAALARAQRLSRIARTQQARLWALIDEIHAEREMWSSQQEVGA